MKDIDIIIPVKNEEASVKSLVERIDAALKKHAISYQIIFVDDHSTDSTKRHIVSLSKKYNVTYHKKVGKMGKAFSILEGSKISTAKYIGMIDGDLQYPPEAIPELYQIAQKTGLAIAQRQKREEGILRTIVSKTYQTIMGKFILGTHHDMQSGLKIFNREIINHISEAEVTPWTIDVALLHTAKQLGYSIGSLPIVFEERKSGSSKIKVVKDSIEIGTQALKYRFKKAQIYEINAKKDQVMGSGIAYKGKRFITHSDLPHQNSALVTFTNPQKATILFILGIFVLGITFSPLLTITIVIAVMTAIYFADVVFSLSVLLKSLHFPPELAFTDNDIDAIKDTTLPLYSILCPLYKEAHILPEFCEAIKELDWPKNKLEVLLLLEEDDKDTIAAAKTLNLPSYFKVIVVPHSFPKTKPKACNYGLTQAKGEYVVIYDAEDKPDPKQLKKAYLGFKTMGAKYICMQGKLNYFNPSQNILTRLFTAEYSLWFDVTLPGLQSIDGTIPLGGTSNHFRTENLRKLHAWDPFNVTEDCDLGIRLFREGYKTAIIDSVTLEEANSRVKNWIRQRSRWIKGYFQTYLVHMRDPLPFFAKHGIQAVLFQLIIGMRITFLLINPILWLTTIAYFAAYSIFGPTIEALYPGPVFYLAAFALVVGNFMYLYNYMIGLAKRGQWELLKYVFLVPVYWILMSVAAFVALYQLIVKPHFWEKTNHGLNKKKTNKKEIEQEAELAADTISAVRSNTGSGLVLGGSAALVIACVIANILNFANSIILVQGLSVSDYAVVTVIGSIIGMLQIPLSAFGRTVTHKAGIYLGKFKHPSVKYWKIARMKSILPSVLMGLGWLVCTPALSAYFRIELLPLIAVTPILLVGFTAAVDNGYLSGSLKFYHLSAQAIGEGGVKTLLTLAFIFAGYNAQAYLAMPISVLVSFFLGYILARAVKGTTNHDIQPEKGHTTTFYISSLATKLSIAAFLSADVLLAKHYLPEREAGIYAVLSTVGKIVFFLGTLFSQFIVPMVSHDTGAKKSSQKTFFVVMGATGLASLIGVVSLGFLGDVTLPILVGSQKAQEIVSLAPLYCIAMAAATMATAVVTYHQAKERHLFAFASVLFSGLMAWAISINGYSIQSIAESVSITSIVYLATVSILHGLYELIPVQRQIAFHEASTKARKILVLNWRDINHKWAGGAEVYVNEIIQIWAKQGHEVTLFCGNDGTQKIREERENITIIRRGNLYTSFIWAFLYYVKEFRGKFDVIVESDSALPFFTPLYSRTPKILIVYHVHQEVFTKYLSKALSVFAKFMERKAIPFLYKNTRVVTISESTKEDLIAMGINKENISVINPGIAETKPMKIRKAKAPLFSYIGRLQHYKNIDILIRAFAEVAKKKKDAQLIIAGFGESRYALETLVKELKMDKTITFAGKVTEKEKMQLFAMSWAAIQPSSYEGWGITVIEANACGTPVIASNVKGLKDSVVHNETGILVAPKRPKILAKAMLQIIKNPTKTREMEQEARNWASRFSWERTANLILLEAGYMKHVELNPLQFLSNE